MANQIQSIVLDKLIPHPDNPNRMSKANFAKLVRNIERTGRYEPLVVRPCPQEKCHSRESGNPDNNRKIEAKCFQIINGHHRCRALRKLGYKSADVVVWDIDEKDADILLATLNRLGGSDVLEKKLTLLKRLNQRMQTRELAKLLPQTAKQLERLTAILNARFSIPDEHRAPGSKYRALVFFVNDKQQQVVENALSTALSEVEQQPTKAMKNAAVLTYIAQQFLNSTRRNTPD